jgi:hypothetical protein
MTPKEKAQNIVSAIYRSLLRNDFLASYHVAKELALIQVDQIMDELDRAVEGWHRTYWNEVKRKIEQL